MLWLFFLPSRPIHKLQTLPEKSGIYYVTAFGIVFYVGKATNLRARWRKHHRLAQFQKLAPFGRLHYRLVPAKFLKKIEQTEIKRLKPLWNYQPIPKFWGRWLLFFKVWLRVIFYSTLLITAMFLIYALCFS